MSMKNFKYALALSLAPIALAAPAPAMAEIYIADPVRAVTDASAILAGFQQVDVTYQSNVATLKTREQEVQQLSQTLAPLDKNGDGAVTPAETASANAAQKNTLAQIEAKNKEIATLEQPIYLAQVYVVEQVFKKYEAAEAKVVKDKKASMLLAPDSVVWAPASADVSSAITAELNRIVPTVAAVPPADWKPSQSVVGLHEQVSKILGLRQYVAALQAAQQAQQAQGGAAAAPAATGETR